MLFLVAPSASRPYHRAERKPWTTCISIPATPSCSAGEP